MRRSLDAGNRSWRAATAAEFRRAVFGLASGLALPVRPAGGSGSARKGGPRRYFLRSGFFRAVVRIFGRPCGWRGRPGQCAGSRPGELPFHSAIGSPSAMPNGRDLLALPGPGAAAERDEDRVEPVGLRQSFLPKDRFHRRFLPERLDGRFGSVERATPRTEDQN